MRQQMLHAELIEVGDHRRSHGLHRTHGNSPLPAPGIHRRQKAIAVSRCVTRTSQQFRNSRAFRLRLRSLRSPRCRGLNATFIRNRRAFAQHLHRQVPHCCQANGQSGQILGHASLPSPALRPSFPQWRWGCRLASDTPRLRRDRPASPTRLHVSRTLAAAVAV